MDDKATTPIKLNIGVGINGTSSISTSVGENSKTMLIKRHGSMVNNVIPSVIVVCEDNLAKTVIGMISREVNGSFKIITAGAWDNMPTLLYGIYFYRDELQASGDKRHLKILCVIDGDIREKDFNEGILETHRGTHVPDRAKKILDQIKDDLVNFELTEDRPFKGLPEYHHQMWLNEISADAIDAHHEARISELELALQRAEEKHQPSIGVELWEIKAKISEVKRIISCSKELPYHIFKDEKSKGKGKGKNKDQGKIDCHQFYEALKGKLMEGDTLMRFRIHEIEYAVLSIIRTYNPTRWESYIAPVKEAMQVAALRHVEMFKGDRFNLTELHDGK